jgi:hypothetical protein
MMPDLRAVVVDRLLSNGMRKAASGFGLVVTAGIGGLAMAGLGASPGVAVFAGIFFALAVVVYFVVGTDDLALFAVGMLVLTITWNGIRVGGGGGASTASGGAFGDVTLVLAAMAVLAHVVRQKKPLPLPPWLMLAGLGCVLAAVLVIVFPPSTKLMQLTTLTQATLAQQGGVTGPIAQVGLASDMLTLIEYELALVVIPVLIMAATGTPRRCRLLMDLWIAGAMLNGFVGVLDYGGIHVGPTPFIQNRSAGLTIHPNYLALTCVIALPMAMLWFGRSRRYTIAGCAALLTLVGGVFASGSRAGTVAAVIALVVTVAVVPRLRRGLIYALPAAGAALIAIMLFTKTGHQILHQLRLGGGSNTTSGSNYQRSLVAHVAWTQIQVRPLEGVGWSVITGAHDIYLELLDAAGVIGLISFLVFMGGVLAGLRRALTGPLRDEAIVCAVAVFAWLLNGIFDNQVADKYLYVVPGLIVAFGRTTWLLQSKRTAPRRARTAAAPRLAPEAVPQALTGVAVR